ncbi:MAG: 2-C-methyl-D-erythritol 2,4-cyclodiphosphate synthase [Candidatus Omnitrophota bacterium]
MYRVGIGYDLHTLVKGRPLILGGVTIPYPKGLMGHSDADVLLHAVCDAILGAAAAGDIGEHFPDADQRYKGADSADLLQRAYAIVRKKGYCVMNIDTVVIAEEPKLTPYKGAIRQRLAQLLKIPAGSVSIKAKTNEGCDDLGAGKAIAAQAVVLLKKKR